VNYEGISANVSRAHEAGTERSATRYTHAQIEGVKVGPDAVQWSLTEDTGEGGQAGLPSTIDMSLTLIRKPARVDYRCRVAEVKGQVTKSHDTQETRSFEQR